MMTTDLTAAAIRPVGIPTITFLDNRFLPKTGRFRL